MLDAVTIPVPDLDAGLHFYRDSLGHMLLWRNDEAAEAVRAAGGRVLAGPSDIPVGRLTVVADPFGNALVLLDLSKGRYVTDQAGQVTGVAGGHRSSKSSWTYQKLAIRCTSWEPRHREPGRGPSRDHRSWARDRRVAAALPARIADSGVLYLGGAFDVAHDIETWPPVSGGNCSSQHPT